MNEPLLSIIIVNYETPDYTLQCIRSIHQNPPSCPYEILLIDNGSEDGSLDLIRGLFPAMFCIETGQNLGFSKANNLGISNARGKYVLLLNSDTKILPGALDPLVEALEQYPRLAIVGPRQVDGSGRLQLAWGKFPTLISEFLRKLTHWRLSINDRRLREYLEERAMESPEVDWVSGSCWMARRQALIDAGMFDPDFFMYFEDLDLCQRVRERGWAIRYASETTIIHYGGISAQKNMLRTLLEYRRSQIHFTRKYYGLRGVATLKTLLFLKSCLNLFRWGLACGHDWLLRNRRESNFARFLLSKKTLELSVGFDPTR
jgi:GT2 family glycosyltransferase